MMVLVDSSVWIAYFRSGHPVGDVDFLIDEDLVATNDLVLTELTPFLRLRRHDDLLSLMRKITRLPMHIDWPHIANLQYACISQGLNGVGIPDLLIADNAMQHRSALYSLDKHFTKMAELFDLELYGPLASADK